MAPCWPLTPFLAQLLHSATILYSSKIIFGLISSALLCHTCAVFLDVRSTGNDAMRWGPGSSVTGVRLFCKYSSTCACRTKISSLFIMNSVPGFPICFAEIWQNLSTVSSEISFGEDSTVWSVTWQMFVVCLNWVPAQTRCIRCKRLNLLARIQTLRDRPSVWCCQSCPCVLRTNHRRLDVWRQPYLRLQSRIPIDGVVTVWVFWSHLLSQDPPEKVVIHPNDELCIFMVWTQEQYGWFDCQKLFLRGFVG